MRLVKLSDLSEEERKKALEKQQERINNNNQERLAQTQRANQQFNEYVNKYGEYDTNKHTTSHIDIINAMKNSGTPKERINTYKKSNRLTLWDSVQDTANGIGKTIENTGLGAVQGIKYLGQTIQRAFNTTKKTNAFLGQDSMFLTSGPAETITDKLVDKIAGTENINTRTSNKDIIGRVMTAIDIKEKGEENYNKTQESINKNQEKINQNIEQIDSPVFKKLASISPSVGQMIPGFIPYVGTPYIIGSAMGQYYEDGKQRGMNEIDASNYASIMSVMEGATEMVGLNSLKNAGKTMKGLVKGTGKIVGKEISKETTKTLVKKALKEYGVGIADNMIQEAIIDPIQELTVQTIAGKDKAQWENIGEKMLEDGINGGLVSAILGGANLGIQSCVGVVDKAKNNQTIRQQEVQQAIKEATQQLDTSKMLKDSVQQQVNKYRDYYTNQELNTDTQNILKQADNIINKNNNSNLEQNAIQNQTILPQQQITQQENKMAQNGNVEQINNNDILPRRNYEYIETNNNKINNLRQDMSKYWTNTEETKALGSVIEKVIIDKGYNVRLDDTIINNKGKSVNAQIKTLDNGEVEIRINPNAQNVGEFLLMHEVTHAIGTKEMKDLVINYASKNTEFSEALETLKQNYNTTELNDEVLADVSGQLFGNQEFINSLVMENTPQSRTIIQKIIDKLTRLKNSFTTEGRYKNFVQNLEMKWREAYQTQNNNLDGKTQYHISENLSANIDTVLSNINERNPIKLRDYTPKALTQNGIKDLPMYENPSHIRKNILTEAEAQQLGLSISSRDHYHGLGKEIYIKAIDSLDNPRVIFKNNNNNDYLILTIIKDKNNNNVVVPMEIETDTKVNNVKIDINRVKTVYGYEEKNNIDLNDYIKHNIKENKFTKIYEQKKEKGTGFSTVANSTNSIPSANTDVNTTTKYSMQESEKNSEFFSLPTKEWQEYLDENYKATGTRTNLEDIKLPTKEYFENKSINNEQNNTKGEKINWNEIERPEGKFRKYYKSIIESSNTTAEAKKIAKEVMGQDTYIPDSNKKQLQKADERISMSGADVELDSMLSKTMNNEKITAVDVAVGERLIEYYSKIGDAQKLQDAIQTTAMIGTELGQAVQAMSILNHQTPQGQVVWIQRSIDKMNNELKQKRGEKAPQFNLTEDMMQTILNSQNQKQLQKNLDSVYKELGQQVHKSTMEQIDSWRYFSMLGNFRTHIRNMTGNFLMGITQDTKNKVAGAIESTVSKFVPNMERTQTIKRASKEVVQFAKNDIQNVLPQLEGNKYNPKNMLESNMKTFKNDILENTLGRMFNWNDNLLEAEDGLGLKSGYTKALTQYITANNIDINNISDKQLAKARNYAIKEAQERTFHQANTIASAINSFTRKNKITKAIGDAVLPFVKTPANVAKTGIEYGPAGLAKTIVYDTVKLRKGNISINQYIDNLSKGLTGSGITILGYALAQAGILKASGSDDDKKEKFDEQSGKQAYSIQVGDKTYSIDWLAPVGIPLMVGAEIYEGLTQKGKEKSSKSTEDEEALNKFLDRAEVLTNSITSTLDPMVEMSMISGLVSSIKSFAQGDTQALSGMITNASKSYINQFVPTLSGQIAKSTDTVERDTTSTKTGMLPKAVDSTLNQIKSKIPGLRQTLPTKKDIWGEDIKLSDNWVMRFAQAGVLPMNIKQINNTNVVKELNDLYDKTGESSMLPDSINKTITIDSQKYRLTNEEYNKYKKDYGKNSYKLINNLINSDGYKKMNDKEKQIAIEKIYSYVKEQNKINYAMNNKLECKTSTLSDTINAIKEKNGNVSDYIQYLSKTEELDKDNEKISYLANSSIGNKTKQLIYENSIGKDDNLYNVMKLTEIDITEYLKFKNQDFKSDKEDDGTLNGKTVSGSKQKKVIEYLNSMDITGNQRLLLYSISGYKTTSNQKEQLINYIDKLDLDKSDKVKLYSKLSGFTVYKNGIVEW